MAIVCTLIPHWAPADLLTDGLPLPDDMSIAASMQNNSTFHPRLAELVGVWGGGPKHLLVIESLAEDGSAKVVCDIGDNPALQIPRQWMRLDAKMTADGRKVLGRGFICACEHESFARPCQK